MGAACVPARRAEITDLSRLDATRARSTQLGNGGNRACLRCRAELAERRVDIGSRGHYGVAVDSIIEKASGEDHSRRMEDHYCFHKAALIDRITSDDRRIKIL